MRYLVETALLWGMGTVFRVLPKRTSLFLGKIMGRSLYYVTPGRRNLSLDNIRHAFAGEFDENKVREMALSSFGYLGMNVAEFFRLPDLTLKDVERYTSITGEGNLAEALAAGNGVLVLSSHLGSWDMLSAGLALRGYPLSLITKVSRSEALNRIWMGYRRQLGMQLLMGRGTMKESFRDLKKGRMVGFALDQNARRREGVFVPFFGREACTITSLALMARRTGVPVLPIYIYREGDMHRIVIDEPIIHGNIEDAETDIFERTRSYVRWTEKVIREHPEQWTWLHDRWKTRPKNGEGVMSKG